ncbi:DUF2516 family protein [Rothia sp. AR01]|uniref:DUF2516 family protein n=1 Tax=Rothia santali TaxID=2949643 RepID=A0A9X2HEL0_9MICC|nr:DUF2516 family protein [Rothia santali]MCP3426282.1 DUF2516 family protein [Rothia santali]
MIIADIFRLLEGYINIFLALVLLVLALWAFVEAARAPSGAYEAAFKRTKNFWMLVTGACLLGAIISVMTAFGGAASLFIQLIAATAAGVFLADVRPAVRNRR